MAKKGAKVEKGSVSDQPHELKYEAKKEDTTPQKVEAAKKGAGSNKRTAVEKKLEGKK
jgi:stalled ribosome alternative rescue factor ArfA